LLDQHAYIDCRQWNHAIDDGREIRHCEAVDLLLAEGADARLKNQQV
jgi:hypothetical protein